MPKQPPSQTVSRLRQKAARARGHANLLVGDEAERRLKELADEIDQQAAALGAGAAPSSAQVMASSADARNTASLAMAAPSASADEYELEHRIRERAYYLWEADGRPAGRDLHFWAQAESQIRTKSDALAQWESWPYIAYKPSGVQHLASQ